LPAARVDGNGTERKEKVAVIFTGIYVSVGIKVSTFGEKLHSSPSSSSTF
jgi:hypothetical protein